MNREADMDGRVRPVISSFDSGIERRDFLGLAGAAAGALALPRVGKAQSPAPASGGWNPGQLAHLIPTASHERFLIKTSFKAPLTEPPRLSVNGKPIDGVQTDPDGRFWRFDAQSLQPATQYDLQITDRGGAPLSDAW